jgi:argininosuccinate lyase
MAEEIVIWSTPEFGFVELHDSYSSTSSIMPQKKNPDTAELIRGKTGTVIGSLMALLAICKALPMSYNRDLQEATPNMWRSVEATRSAVRIMSGIAGTMKVNTDAMAAQSTAGFTTATELADTMVRATGIPFRTAHQIVGVLARSKGIPSLKDVDAVSSNLLGTGLSDRGLTEEMVTEAMDPLSNIKRRRITGGPSPDETGRAIGRGIEELEAVRSTITRLNDSIETSLKCLFEVSEKCIEGSGE